MNLSGKKIVVVGLARTGLETARFLAHKKARVTITDRLSRMDLGRPAQLAEEMGCCLELGGHDERTFSSADLVVVSPGVPHTIKPLEAARKAGVPVIGEMELAFSFLTIPVIAVTGTNGKTTTTAFLGHIFETAGIPVFVGGNIGRPLIESCRLGEKFNLAVVEVSSFQLDTISKFRPNISILLNITPDHLDRYGTCDAYAASKATIFKNQTFSDTAVINQDDATVVKVSKIIKAKPLSFGFNFSPGPRKNGAVLEADHGKTGKRKITFFHNGQQEILDVSKAALKGRHNLENMAAAFLAAREMGVHSRYLLKAAVTFKAPPHRMEKVADTKGISWYNDSKATNPVSVVRALESFSRNAVLILGGRNKNSDFSILQDPVKKACRFVVLYGEAALDLEKTFSGAIPLETVRTLKEAVSVAAGVANTGDVVLLSPACASFDQHENYEARGEEFCRLVRELP